MADNGLTQINDIVLDIPPEQIKVERKSFNHQWQTLRTRSSIKVKSGFSCLDVFMTIQFTDDFINIEGSATPTNGMGKLRNLISQFRVTPFCYVENDFLRNSILGGESTINMALALKNMEILKTNDSTNVITVRLLFSWFNYFPYTRSFSFKDDIFSPVEVKDPAQSRAWKLLYSAEQARNNYLQVAKLDPSFNTSFAFNQFSQITISRYNQLEKEVSALTKLRDQLQNANSSDSEDSNVNVTDTIRKTLLNELQNNDWANSVATNIFGNSTSMYEGTDAISDALNIINQNISPGSNSDYNLIVDRDKWQPVILDDGKPVVFKNELTKVKVDNEEDSESFDRQDVLLLTRQRSLTLEQSGLIIQAISISFENILATMPLIGHPYPSFQHIGSTDARITLSIITTSENSVQDLSAFYTMIEDQAHRYRTIPAGQRNIVVTNQLINMCGLSEMIPEALVIETVEGSPGTYAAELVLIDNPLTAETDETLTPGQSFNNSNTLRKQIATILENNLKLADNAFIKDKGPLGFGGNGDLTLRNLDDGGLFEGNTETGYYQYSGPNDQRNQAFKDLCVEYGKNLGELLEKVFPVLYALKAHPLNTVSSFSPEDFFSLTDDDVLGVEKIQGDILNIISSLKSDTDTTQFEALGAPANSYIYQAKSAIAKTDNFFDVYNRLNAAKTSSVLSDDGRETTIKEVFSELDPLKNDQRISYLMNSLMMDWLGFVIPFIDRIRLSGLIDLPQFDQVRDMIRTQPINSASLAYQDFPLAQVLNQMSTSDDESLTQAYNRLKDLFDKSGLANKNVNLAGLLNPDFYFFNPQNDLTTELIPSNIIDTARNSIKLARQAQEPAEGDWFKKVYEGSYLSQDKVDKITSLVAISDDSLKSSKDSNDQKQVSNYNQRLSQSMNNRMAPPDLIGSVGPSIQATKDNSNGVDKPITLTALNVGGDQQNVYMNYRPATTLSGPKNSYNVQHRFDTDDCLDYLPENAYVSPVRAADPNTLPVIAWPTYSNCRRVTSAFGRRTPPIEGASSYHRGIDIAAAVPGTAEGSPVLAAADGQITGIAYSPTEKSQGQKLSNEGVFINITHSGGLVTKYYHLKWDDAIQSLSDIFWRKGPSSIISADARNAGLSVTKGTRIGTIGNTGHGSGAHLHFETWINGTAEDPIRVLEGDFNPARTIVAGIDPNNESLLKKSIDQFEKELRTGQGYGMTRAYPTFKLYFIESDLGERKRYSFDDFFAYSSVKEIQVIRSRKIAADLCMIQLTNISGVLSNRKFSSAINPDSAKDARGRPAEELAGSPQRVNTENENPIASLMLQPGIQIQLRLGYSNNPEELETVFNGVITDVEFTESDDLVQITCQSFAVELVQSIQGDVKEFGGFAGGILSGDSRTEVILNELLASPEVVHFGRWEGGSVGLNSQRGLLQNKWQLVPTPQDDNLFPPQGQALSWFRAILGTSKYIMYNTTIWDVFQEMTLRHPSYVASPVPYVDKDGNPRMTMFFGLPDQLYFARDATSEEDNILTNMKRIIQDNQALDNRSEQALQKIMDASSNPGAGVMVEGLSATQTNKLNIQRDQWFSALAKQYATNVGFIKPFRNYHVLTSSLHILKNSISGSGHNTFNTVTVQYSNSSPRVGSDSGELNFGNLKTFTLKGDAAIQDEEVRELLAQYPNCVGDEQAKRYAVSLLFQSLKEAYKGDLCILGNPTIKPYDVCYIFDEYTDMFGPIEVEQVVHKFSQQNGFITEITPDLMVHVNQWATLSTSDAMGLIAEHGLKSIGMQSLGSIVGSQQTPLASRIDGLGPALGTVSIATSVLNFNPIVSLFFNSSENSIGVNGDTSLFGLTGTFIFRKLITRTQLAHPFRFSPLVLGAKPMIGGLPNRRTDGSFIQGIGKWFKEAQEGLPLLIDDTRDRMNPHNWIHMQGDLGSTLLR